MRAANSGSCRSGSTGTRVGWVAGPQLAFDRVGMAPYRGVSKRRSGRREGLLRERHRPRGHSNDHHAVPR